MNNKIGSLLFSHDSSVIRSLKRGYHRFSSCLSINVKLIDKPQKLSLVERIQLDIIIIPLDGFCLILSIILKQLIGLKQLQPSMNVNSIEQILKI